MHDPLPEIISHGFCVWLGIALLAGCGESTPPKPQSLMATAAGIWTDADVGTDPQFSSLFPGNPGEGIGPRELRELLTAWPNQQAVRNLPQELGFLCGKEHAVFFWKGRLFVPRTAEDVENQLDAKLFPHGYELVDDDAAIENLVQRLGLPPPPIFDDVSFAPLRVYVRHAGETKLVVRAQHLVTGHMGTHVFAILEWFAGRPYSAAPPTLSVALALLPDWARVPYIKDDVWDSIATEPISAYRVGNGVAISFVKDLGDAQVVQLEGAGFEYWEELEPLDEAGKERFWYRFPNTTDASSIAGADPESPRFHYEPPRHRPRTIRMLAPPRHPNLLVPLSKRPKVEFSDLPFADAELKRRTQLSSDLAGRLAGAGWHVQPFRDHRDWEKLCCLANWRTSRESPTDFTAEFLPYRGVEIELSGPPIRTGPEQLTVLKVDGSWIPLEGWRAWSQYTFRSLEDGRRFENSFRVSVSDGHSEHDSDFALTDPGIGANTRKDLDNSYSFHTQLPADDEATSRLHIRALFESPESLRNVSLGKLQSLRMHVRKRFEALDDSEFIHSFEFQPGCIPRGERRAPPDERTRLALLADALAGLDRREQRIRDACVALHEAITKALPLGELLKRFEEGQAAPERVAEE